MDQRNLDMRTERDLRYHQRWEAHVAADKERAAAIERAFAAALIALEKSIVLQLANAAMAVQKSEGANEKRFDSVNEFRAALSDQTARLMPRTEVDGRIAAIGEKIGDLSARLDRSDGKGIGVAALWGVILGAAGLFAVVATLILSVVRFGH